MTQTWIEWIIDSALALDAVPVFLPQGTVYLLRLP